ncbi:MAG: hypothetical protein H0W90_05950 [Actinobacteria bacterium]|nr:hypothetical protein [Actinomycetota bacterium]
MAGVLAIAAQGAQASSEAWHRVDLDAIASDIAQRPVEIYCVESKQEWYDVMVNGNGLEPQDVFDVLGGTWPIDWNDWKQTPDHRLYLSLSVCQTLRALNPAAGTRASPDDQPPVGRCCDPDAHTRSCAQAASVGGRGAD